MVETPVLRPWRVLGFATASIALTAFLNVFVKLASQEGHSVVEIMFFRNFLAAIPLLMLIQANPLGFSLLKTSRPFGHVIRGSVGTFSMTLYFMSFTMLPLADATALYFAMPIILTALSVPFLKEHVGPWRWGAVIVGFVGVIIIAAPTGDTPLLGTVVGLASAFTASITMMIVRRLGSTEHALTIVFYFSVIGAILTGIMLPWFWSPPSLLSFFYLMMTGVTGGLGQVFLTKAYAEAPAAYVSPFSYLSIIFAAFFGWAIWGQVPTMHVVIGSGIVILSGLFILWRETRVKRHLVQDSVLETAPTQADIMDESGQSSAERAYEAELVEEETREAAQ